MRIIKCKMCGGDIELTADKTFGTCEYCGSTMTLPKVPDDQRAAAFNRGNYFRRTGEFDKALAVYERIVQEDDTDAEAHWCCALCRFGIEYVEDPVTYEWVPTCHRASFDSFLEDVDYLAAVEHSEGITKRQYQKEAMKIADVQKGILATSQNEEPFDVFICYKESEENGERTRDSILAQEIYYQLTEQGRRVFFARITLEDKVGTEYEPYIFAALNSSKVMIIVGTTPEHFSAVWVKNEWSRFLALMRKDRKKLLLPCYRDMDPYDLPEQLSVLQSYDMAKIGFIQDLIHGVNKVLDADKRAEPQLAKETVVVQQNAAGSNVAALLKRGNMALDDGEWEKADGFFEEVLNQDAECAEAYLGKALAEEKCENLLFYKLRLDQTATTEYTVSLSEMEDTAHVAEIVQKYTVPNFLKESALRNLYAFDFSIQSTVREQEICNQKQLGMLDQNRNFSRAMKFAQSDFKAQLTEFRAELENRLNQHLDDARKQEETRRQEKQAAYEKLLPEADAKAEEMYQSALKTRDQQFQRVVERVEKASSIRAYEDAKKELTWTWKEYQKAEQLIARCDDGIAKLKAREVSEAKETRRKMVVVTGIIAAVVAIVVVIALIVTKTIIPLQKYKSAEQLLAHGDTSRAAIVFGQLGEYKDAAERAVDLWNVVAERETISVGYRHTVGLCSDGTVVAVGDNERGQYDVSGWTDIVAISAGLFHTVGLKSDGTVVAGHYNEYGACDVSNWTDIVAISAGEYHTVGLKSNSKVVVAGKNNYGQCDVSNWTDIVAISAGDRHTVGLKSDGTVVAVGSNASGQCDVSDWTDIVAISAGYFHTVGLKSDGTVVAAGKTDYEQCDVSDWTDIVTISAGGSYTVGLKSDGTVVAVGNNSQGRCDVSGWTDIIAISAGNSNTVGLKSDGTVVAVGDNNDDQCDISDWKGIKIPG